MSVIADPLTRSPTSKPLRNVAPSRDHRSVDVIERARDQGFELEEQPLNGQWVWAWRRGDDDRWPCYLEERQALAWMADRLRRSGVFEQHRVTRPERAICVRGQ